MSDKLIFISHATPEDNYCATWLSSKLKLLGYNVWIDLDDLSTGDSFNTVIKPIIKEKTEIFIPITTRTYTYKSQNQNSGVARELNCASTINIKELGHNFILPVRFDDTPFDDFPYTYTGWRTIDFYNNWQQGLIELIEELEDLQINKIELKDDVTTLWFKAIRAQNKPIKRKEQYFSNWFDIKLPDNIFIHQPKNFSLLEINTIPYPLITEAKYIISFTTRQTTEKYTLIENTYELPIATFTQDGDFSLSNGFTLKEPKKKLIKLLNNAFYLHLTKQGLICWKRGKNKNKVFYFRNQKNNANIPLKRYNKTRSRRSLCGQVNETIDGKNKIVNWSFSISPYASLFPSSHYELSYGLVFTDQYFIRFDKKLQHKLRRSIPREWYNRKWFDTLLAAMLRISPTFESKYIEIELDENKSLSVNNQPLAGDLSYGYIEPSDVE